MANTKLRNEIRDELMKSTNDRFTPYSKKYACYCKDYNENIVGNPMTKEHKKMFSHGSGSELQDVTTPAKAKAIDSSSMLSYNFFRNVCEDTPLTIDNIIYDKVFFEVQLKTLPRSSYPANMDVVLLSNDGKDALFIESKFLEYIDLDKVELSNTYKKLESYYDDNNEKKDLYEMAKKFNTEDGRYNYGIKQNICHLIGISNLLHSAKARKTFYDKYIKIGKEQLKILDASNYRFMNLIFKPRNNEAKELFDKYHKELNCFKSSLPSIISSYIKNPFVMTYKQLYDTYRNLPNNIKDGLNKRYIDHHAEE